MSLKWPLILIAPALLALACGGDGSSTAPSPTPSPAVILPDDGGGNDEDAIRDTLQLVTDACNAGDSERVQELETSALPGCPDGGTEDFEVLSVTVEGFGSASGRCTAKCQGQVDVTRTRADNGETEETTLIFRKEGGSWLLQGLPTPTPTPEPRVFTIPPGTLSTGALLFLGGEQGIDQPPGVFLVDADGVRRIGDNLYDGDIDPQQISISGSPSRLEWSPDGTKAAFWVCLFEPFDTELYVIDSDGSRLTNVSSHPAPDVVQCPEGPFGGFDWSPDSESLVFWSTREPRGLYVVNADGSGTRYLTEGRKPAWSATGDSIVLVSEPSDPIEDDEDVSGASIYLVDNDGSNRRLLATVPCGGYFGGCRAPELRWSPDGSLLAFTAVPEPPENLYYEENLNHDVFVLNSDGTGLMNITNRPGVDRFANWVNCALPLPTAGCEVAVTGFAPQLLEVIPDVFEANCAKTGCGPATDEQAIGNLSEGDTACLLGSPALRDGLQWWPVRTSEDTEGWAAAFGLDGPAEPWMAATGRTCQGEQIE